MAPPLSLGPEVTGAFVDAVQHLQGKRLQEAHLIRSLLRVSSVSLPLGETGVKLPALTSRIEQHIQDLPARSWFTLSVARVEAIQRAASRCSAAGWRELTAPFLFASIAQDAEPGLAAALSATGFSLLEFRYRIAHGARRPSELLANDEWLAVELHNDPFTPVALVETLLREELGFNPATAKVRVDQIAREGRAVVATLENRHAVSAAARMHARAAEQTAPLRVELVFVPRPIG